MATETDPNCFHSPWTADDLVFVGAQPEVSAKIPQPARGLRHHPLHLGQLLWGANDHPRLQVLHEDHGRVEVEEGLEGVDHAVVGEAGHYGREGEGRATLNERKREREGETADASEFRILSLGKQ